MWCHRRILDVLAGKHYAGDRTRSDLTFLAIFAVDRKVKVGTVTEAALDDDIALELEYRNACSVEFDTGRLLLRLEFEKD